VVYRPRVQDECVQDECVEDECVEDECTGRGVEAVVYRPWCRGRSVQCVYSPSVGCKAECRV
jgi:hypothetical protein